MTTQSIELQNVIGSLVGIAEGRLLHNSYAEQAAFGVGFGLFSFTFVSFSLEFLGTILQDRANSWISWSCIKCKSIINKMMIDSEDNYAQQKFKLFDNFTYFLSKTAAKISLLLVMLALRKLHQYHNILRSTRSCNSF